MAPKRLSLAQVKNHLQSQAAQFVQANRTMFTPFFSTEIVPTHEWGQMVTAIEQTGWILSQWSVAVDPRSGNFIAFPVFRRR
jgi:hypothetical protein